MQDVLYVLQLSPDRHERGYYCPTGAANWSTYIENTLLVAAAVASRVLNMEHYDEAKACKMIAKAIIDFCPPQAKCLFNSAFVEAQEEAEGMPSAFRSADCETLRATCGCPECKKSYAEEKRHRL